MADYYPVLSRAIAGLDQNTADARRAVYERARTAIVKQLRSYDPPLSESDITRERLGLEDAIRRVETEQRSSANPAMRGSDPVESVRQAAVDAERLGPAATAAQSRAAADQADLDGYPAQTEAPRLEPRFSGEESPANARPSQQPPQNDAPRRRFAGDNDSEAEEGRKRGPAVFAIIAVLLLAGLGVGAYVMRDTLTGGETATAIATDAPSKNTDRAPNGEAPAENATDEGEEETAPPAEPQATPEAQPGATTAPGVNAPATAQQDPTPPAVAPVAQRSVLYEESPDQQAGTAVNGTTVWRVESVPNAPGNEPQVRAEIDMPTRNIKLVMVIRRNTDATLPASHTVEMQFTLSPQFANGGIANVPGILFKAGEDAGGTALAGLSVKVMNGFFLIGLSNTPNDKANNLRLMRESAWIDLPLLYENGRRAVLSLELGAPGQQAFAQAIEAWNKTDAAAAPAASPAPAANGAPAATPAP